ncbi:MAG: hypothetical protein KDF24_09080 [Rhodocyclaceae bacterium]|nr:hypothetical protein [Rhodocyclaceae bacterium]MCB1963307.1 hypothetical protein [Rhodocyclaceae bacterium]
MIDDGRLALFVMLGQTATKTIGAVPEVAHSEPLHLSDSFDLSAAIPDAVRSANSASEAYRLFYVFENYLREFVLDVLTGGGKSTWWDKVPKDVQDEIQKIEDNEELKGWMALGSRDKSALMTYPQLLRVIDYAWKEGFADIVRDKALVQEARHITHLRNTVCHMSNISEEELGRVKQVMRDWFRVVSP